LGSQHNCALLAAGPVNIHERVLRAMNVPGQNHRDPFFAPFFKQLVQDSK
jgi:alanine-glyoxylate transaminase/serine-glyoxylate transaminase/serine-pyruvate transaminase